MIRTIKFVVDCKDQDEFTKIYLSIDDMWVEQVKSMTWEEGDTISPPPKSGCDMVDTELCTIYRDKSFKRGIDCTYASTHGVKNCRYGLVSDSSNRYENVSDTTKPSEDRLILGQPKEGWISGLDWAGYDSLKDDGLPRRIRCTKCGMMRNSSQENCPTCGVIVGVKQ